MTYVEVVADEIKAVTTNAYLCEFEDVGEVWLPLSQMEKAPEAAVGDRNVVLSIAQWLARKHDLD
jgi:hypothetical protein